MTSTADFLVALVKVPDLRTGRKLAQALLQDRLAACVNIVPGIESHYRWKGKLERGREWLLLIKTNRRRLPALEKRVLALHPYDTPEIITLPIKSSTPRYLAWLRENIAER